MLPICWVDGLDDHTRQVPKNRVTFSPKQYFFTGLDTRSFVVKNTMFVLAPGVIVEDMGSDTAVFVPGVSEVLTMSGAAAITLRRIRLGESVECAEAVVSDLVSLGVIQPAGGMSRRGVVRAGVIGAGAGIAAFAMPHVAAASSPIGGVGVLTQFVALVGRATEGVSTAITEGSFQVAGRDAEGNDLGIEIASSDLTGPITARLKDETSDRVTIYTGSDNRFSISFLDSENISFDFFRGRGHILTFTYKGTQYVVDF